MTDMIPWLNTLDIDPIHLVRYNPNDFLLCCAFVFIMLGIRFLVYHLLNIFIQRMQVKPSKIPKIKENIWYTIFYGSTCIFTMYISWNLRWFWNTSLLYTGLPFLADFEGCRILYLVQFSFYLHLVIALVFVDERLSDFDQMLVHHVITLSLVFLSYRCIWHRLGLVVFFLHDIGNNHVLI